MKDAFPSKYLACSRGHRWWGWQTAALLILHSGAQQSIIHVPSIFLYWYLSPLDLSHFFHWGSELFQGSIRFEGSWVGKFSRVGFVFSRVCHGDVRLGAGFESLSSRVFEIISFYVYVCRYIQILFMEAALWVSVCLEYKKIPFKYIWVNMGIWYTHSGYCVYVPACIHKWITLKDFLFSVNWRPQQLQAKVYICHSYFFIEV